MKGHFHFNLHCPSKINGPDASPIPVRSWPNRGTGRHHGWRHGGLSAAYEAPNTTGFDPTWSRRLGDLILLTCGDEISPRRASDDGAAQPVFNDGESSFRRWSGSKGCSDGGGAGRGSSMWRIGPRDSDAAARWWRCQWQKMPWFGEKSAQGRPLYIGVFDLLVAKADSSRIFT
jgi:hypothetical protein